MMSKKKISIKVQSADGQELLNADHALLYADQHTEYQRGHLGILSAGCWKFESWSIFQIISQCFVG